MKSKSQQKNSGVGGPSVYVLVSLNNKGTALGL